MPVAVLSRTAAVQAGPADRAGPEAKSDASPLAHPLLSADSDAGSWSRV
jgi:hypothetical protein